MCARNKDHSSCELICVCRGINVGISSWVYFHTFLCVPHTYYIFIFVYFYNAHRPTKYTKIARAHITAVAAVPYLSNNVSIFFYPGRYVFCWTISKHNLTLFVYAWGCVFVINYRKSWENIYFYLNRTGCETHYYLESID